MTDWERPEKLPGFTIKTKTGHGILYITINEFEGKPIEIFAVAGKSGRSITAKTEAIGRLVSLNLQSGVDVREIIKQLKGIGGEQPIPGKGKDKMILSIPDAIGQILEQEYIINKRGELFNG